MAARVFKHGDLAAQIATYLLSMSTGATVSLALTCQDLEVPALRVLWEKQDSLSFLIKCVLPTDMQYCVSPPDTDLRLLVSHLFLFGQHPAYSSIVNNTVVVAATNYPAGVEPAQTVRFVDAST